MINVIIGNNVSRSSHIIDENTTLRAALEESGIDYSVGMTSLDGSTCAPGDLDKTFADFGITEKCYLLNIVKADNAACIKVAGSACVLESEYTLADIQKLAKYAPNSLSLFEDKNEVFRVGISPKGSGSVSACGVSFCPQTNPHNKASVTVMIPESVSDARQWVIDTFGPALLNLNRVESQLQSALNHVQDEVRAIENSITVL